MIINQTTISCSTEYIYPHWKWRVTHRFLMSVAPLNAFLGMDWMKFSLKSLRRQKVGVSHTSASVRLGAACFSTRRIHTLLSVTPAFTTLISAEQKAERDCFLSPKFAKTLRCGAAWSAVPTTKWLFNSGCIIQCSLML